MNWISVKDKLPEEVDLVDIYIEEYDERWTGYKYLKDHKGQTGNCFFEPVGGGLCCVRNVSHWMYVPESPKKEQTK